MIIIIIGDAGVGSVFKSEKNKVFSPPHIKDYVIKKAPPFIFPFERKKSHRQRQKQKIKNRRKNKKARRARAKNR